MAGPSQSSPSVTHTGGNPNLDLSDYLDPGDRIFRTNASTPKVPFFQNYPAKHTSNARTALSDDDPGGALQSDGDDPISLKILSQSEAVFLVDL